MLNDVYNRRILELAGGIPRLGRLDKPDASATAHSKLCGSTVTVDLKMDGDTVTDFAHEVKACALARRRPRSWRAMWSARGPTSCASCAKPCARCSRRTARRRQRQMGRYRGARAGARLQGAPRLDPADLRRGGRCHRPDRRQAPTGGELGHDPERWPPVSGTDHAQTRISSHLLASMTLLRAVSSGAVAQMADCSARQRGSNAPRKNAAARRRPARRPHDRLHHAGNEPAVREAAVRASRAMPAIAAGVRRQRLGQDRQRYQALYNGRG